MLTEIRTSLELSDQNVFPDSVSTLRFAYNKRIPLQEFHKHTIQGVQVFDNNFELGVPAGATGEQVIRHTLLTTYPVSFNTFETDFYGATAPNAASENVHYRQTEVFTLNGNQYPERVYQEEFPIRQLAGYPSLAFYTPFLYLTVMYEFPGFNDSDVTLLTPSFSVYCAVEEEAVGMVEYSMGIIAERESAHWVVREANGRNIPSTITSLALETFPMWVTSRRPQGMLRYDTVGGDTSFYWNLNNDTAEEMRDIAGVRTDSRFARQMVQFNEAFGRERLGTFYPDWLATIVSNLRGGNERVSTRTIPHRQSDTGTTLMFQP
jgi:hypothetical protein